MSATPAVSVVVTSYNYGQYLAEALESLGGQTRGDFEAVIVDDGSTDNTPEVAARFLGDSRFRYHRTAHVGQPAAKNQGLALTSAPWVAFLDADDRWRPTKLERQLALAETDPELGVIYSCVAAIDTHGRPLTYNPPAPQRGWVLAAMFSQNFVCFSSCLIRRNALAARGAFDERLPLAIDYELWLRLAGDYRFDYVDEVLVDYRTGHANLSRRTEERLELVLGIMDRFVADSSRRERLAPAVIRRAYLDTLGNLALARREESSLAALATYARSLRWSLVDWPTWRGIGSALLPAPARNLARKLAGRPDWRTARPTAEASLAPGLPLKRGTS